MHSASASTYSTVVPWAYRARASGARQQDLETVVSNSHAEPLLLSIAELRELSGYRNHGAQVRWLAANSIPYFLDSCGRPRVLRRAIEQRLGFRENGGDSDLSTMPAHANIESRPRPNFTSLLSPTLRTKGYRGS